MTSSTFNHISRRSLVRGAAWALPTAMVAAAAPAIAASIRKDPGINGWVLVRPDSQFDLSRWRWTYRLEIDSTGTGGRSTPDGAPFGLYLYDTEDAKAATDASITVWILGDHRKSDQITWSSSQGHSQNWSGPSMIGTQVKPDGMVYTGYRWTYRGEIQLGRRTQGRDGVYRVFLDNFHVRTNYFTQDSDYRSTLNYWTERAITIEGDTQTFQRREGTDGAYNASARRAAPRPAQARSTSPSGEPTEEDEIPLQPTVC